MFSKSEYEEQVQLELWKLQQENHLSVHEMFVKFKKIDFVDINIDFIIIVAKDIMNESQSVASNKF